MLTLYSLLAAVVAVGLEWVYRAYPSLEFRQLWPVAWGASFAVAWCIFHLVRGAPTLLSAFVLWATATLGLRVFVSVVLLRDEMSWQTWAAVGLITAARVIEGLR